MKLPTATDLKLDSKPCDICGKTDHPVSFWGMSSVLTCRRTACNEEVLRRYNEILSENTKLAYNCEDEDY